MAGRSSLVAALVTVLALASLASGCSALSKPAKVTFASDPPGARVFVDEKDSGFVTPCVLALERRRNLRVDFVHPEYRTATRWLSPDREAYVIYREEMYVRSDIWHFYFWLNAKDFFAPVKVRRTLEPGRVYVRLERAADST